jgi:hypothetical protein
MALPLLGISSMLSRIVPAASRGYKTFQTARRVGGLGKYARALPQSNFSKIMGTEGAGLGRGTSGTGLQGLMARGAKKYPGATGGLETGVGLSFGGEGVMDVGQGLYEGDYGQVLKGIGGLALGVPLAARGTRILGSQRTFSKNMPKAAEAFRQTGKGIGEKIPMGAAAAVGIGGYGAGSIFEGELSNPVDETIQQIEYDKANPEEFKENTGFDVGSEEYKKIAREALTQAYAEAEKQKMKIKQPIEEVFKSFSFNPSDTGGTIVTNEAKMPLIKDPENPNLSAEEVQDIANRQLEQSNKGAEVKKALLKSAKDQTEADEFNKFYNRITNLTGGNDQTNNLLLFKFATGLMKGKTGQGGVRGFLDVLGQAGDETTDTAMALYTKEKDRRNDLAVAYLKAKEKTGGGMKIEKDRKLATVYNKSFPWGARTIEIATDKETGLDAMIIPNPETGGTMAVPMKYEKYEEKKPAVARLDKRRKQLNSIEAGYELATAVASLPPGTFGAGGRLRLATEDVIGSVGSIFSVLGFGDIGGFNEEIDAKIINDIIGSKKINETGDKEIEPTEKERKETSELQSEYRREVGKINKGIRPGDKDLDNITKARLIEVRMKYILANALKDEDRLTRADIEDAAQATNILKWTSSDRTIKSSYKDLAEKLQSQFDRVARDYIVAGGNEEYLMGFEKMPKVAEILGQRQNQLMKNNIMQNRNNVIGTIK